MHDNILTYKIFGFANFGCGNQKRTINIIVDGSIMRTYIQALQ